MLPAVQTLIRAGEVGIVVLGDHVFVVFGEGQELLGDADR